MAARLTLGAPCRRSACGADPDVQAAVGAALRADSVLLPRLRVPSPKRAGEVPRDAKAAAGVFLGVALYWIRAPCRRRVDQFVPAEVLFWSAASNVFDVSCPCPGIWDNGQRGPGPDSTSRHKSCPSLRKSGNRLHANRHRPNCRDCLGSCRRGCLASRQCRRRRYTLADVRSMGALCLQLESIRKSGDFRLLAKPAPGRS